MLKLSPLTLQKIHDRSLVVAGATETIVMAMAIETGKVHPTY